MDKSKIYMIIGICTLCIVLIGGTVAYYRNTLFNDLTVNTITNGLDYYINYNKGTDISGELTTSSDYTGGSSAEVEFWKKDNTYDIYGHIYIDINEIGTNTSNSDTLKYTVINTSTNKVISTGDFYGSKTGTSLLVASNIPLETTKQLYKVYVWIDKNGNLDAGMEGEALSLTIRCEASMEIINNNRNLVEYISNLYNNLPKSTVTNNNIEYNYATSVSLMNDRLGGTTSDYNAGNIRYYGASPNNYIDIGDHYEQDTIRGNWEDFGGPFTNSEECYTFMSCSNLVSMGMFDDEATCEANYDAVLQENFGITTTEELCGVTTIKAGTPKLYRIIGLFKDVEMADGTKGNLIKVIRSDSIGSYSWDQSSSDINNGYGINEWSQADLMKLLNSGSENETVGGSLYWNSGAGTCYGYDDSLGEYTAVPCDLTNTGLSSSVHNKIATVKWNLGGWNNSSIYSNQIYGYERLGNVVVPGTTCSGSWCNDTVTRTTVWTGKIALMYPSDYGYATDFNNCGSTLFDYYNTGCYDNDWLTSGNGNWLLTPRSGNASGAWVVSSAGYVDNGYGVYYASGVRPVFYLNSELSIASGDGSQNNPLVLA